MSGLLILDELQTVLAAFAEMEVDYVLIGGAALNAHGILRATEDIDVMVRPTAGNVERLRRALRTVWDDPAIDEITHEDLSGEFPALRYGPPSGDLYLDIISRLGESIDFSGVESEDIEIGDVTVRVASPRALYEMKKDTVRPIDRADADRLRARFHLGDE